MGEIYGCPEIAVMVDAGYFEDAPPMPRLKRLLSELESLRQENSL